MTKKLPIILVAVWLGAMALAPRLARAKHLVTAITVAAGKAEARGVSFERVTGLRQKSKHEIAGDELPTLRWKRGQPLALRWYLKNPVDAKVEKVLVHVSVKTEEAANNPERSNPTKGSVYENAFVMDFKPKQVVAGTLDFAIHQPGSYIAEIETLNSQGKHEHFSRLRLRVR